MFENRPQRSLRALVEQEPTMPELISAPDRLRTAEECRLKEANALLVARQTDDPAGKHEWNVVARDWKVLAVAASAQEEMGRLTLSSRSPTAEPAQPETPYSTARVLVAEDNAINQAVLIAILRHGGVEPVMADNGAEAVEAWSREPWDLILMDVQMPVLDGVAATRAIRAREASSGRAHTPIVAVTANVMPAQIQSYYLGGMDDVIAKPIDIDRLFAVIGRILEPEALPVPA
jgi:CheY-like chemotaxis protein